MLLVFMVLLVLVHVAGDFSVAGISSVAGVYSRDSTTSPVARVSLPDHFSMSVDYSLM